MSRFAMTLGGVACCAVLAAVAPPSLAQAREAAAGGPLGSSSERSALVDINQIDPETFHHIAARLPRGVRPHVDGQMDDEVWTLAPSSGNFIQLNPTPGAAATEPTEFRILYDDSDLYFGFWAYDSDPSGIRASEMKRDALLRKGDQIKIVIDTFHDHRNAFFFSTNPLGAQKDGFASDNGRMNWDWNAVWECGASTDQKGWYAEMRVPLSQLRFKGGPADTTWGLNVARVVIRKNEDSYWVPFPREWGMGGINRASHLGVLVGLKGLEPKRRLELVPYVAPQVARDYDAGTPTKARANYGADLRVGLTSTITADLTYKTDFAQVEADQEVVNLTRFSLFFPEKRQFFTEAAGIFNYGKVAFGDDPGPGLLALFYSRRIGLGDDGREIPILGGGRVSGRTGPYALGLMNIETDAASYALPDGRRNYVPRANHTVARIKRNVFGSSSIGAIALSRAGGVGAPYNRTLGIDGVFMVNRALSLTTLLAKTFSPGSSGRDAAGGLNIDWKTDRYAANVTYLDVGQRFNAEMGYIPRGDIRNSKVRAEWTPRPHWRGVRQLTLGARVDYFENHRGATDSRTSGVDFSVAGHDNTQMSIGLDRDYDLLPSPFRIGAGEIPPGGHDWDTFRASYSSNPGRRVYGGGGVDIGGYYNGEKRTYRATFNVLPTETLLVETSYTRNAVKLPDRAVDFTNTLSTRVSWSLSPSLFVKGFFQYNDERRLANLNLLLWSIYRPGSDLYVVYNHGWEPDAPGPASFRVRNRMLAIKLTYWLSR
ncbi:MAG: carbohydrate binding family 9 domain-containing protein [Acidobacteria bacterium]|nr:carbohydrate binding family 9 domain-containing protein [Acidobacteriota bacterium]